MAQKERYGSRGLEYSAFHRTNSICRYLPFKVAIKLSQIDLDCIVYVEYEDDGKHILLLALIETARDVGQQRKCTEVTLALGRKAKLEVYTVLYRLAQTANPADARYRDIDEFRMRRVWPSPEQSWRMLKPEEYARWLVALHKLELPQTAEPSLISAHALGFPIRDDEIPT